MYSGSQRFRFLCGSKFRSSWIPACLVALVAAANACDRGISRAKHAVDEHLWANIEINAAEGREDERDLDMMVGRHHTLEPKLASISRRRRHVVHTGNTSSKKLTTRAMPKQVLPESLQLSGKAVSAFERPTPIPGLLPFLPYSKWPRGLELMIGILLGIFVTFLGWMAYLRCWPHRKRGIPPRTPMTSLSRTLDCGRFDLSPFEFHGAFFNQFSWTLHAGGSFRDRDCTARIFDCQSDQQVARGVGRLMSMPNGEMYLASTAQDHGSDVWCILRRPAPSRRQGQLWDFKVCHANGTHHSEVRQRSETKCLVNDAVSKHTVMTVLGNFTYPVFLSGARSIHVWASQADGQACMVAQCEAKVDGVEIGALAPGSSSESSHRDTLRDLTSESSSYLPPSNVHIVVTTSVNVDASLVLAVLLGLQDVHCSGRPDTPAELSSASTGSSWRDFSGMRASSGGSTVATLGSEGRRQPRFFSQAAKAAAMPSELEAEV